MTIEDYAIERDGYIDIDVTDTEIDIYVAFTYTLGDTSDDQYKILDKLSKNVKIVREDEDLLVCDFSGYIKRFNQKIKEYYNPSEYDEEDSYLYVVEKLPSIISGYATNETYKDIITILGG